MDRQTDNESRTSMSHRYDEQWLANYTAKREAPLNGTSLGQNASPALRVARSYSFVVFGVAQPAGSKQAFVPLNKKAICTCTGEPLEMPFRRPNGGVVVNVVDDNPASRKWKKHVAKVAREEYGGPVFTGPIKVTMLFYRERPKSHLTSTGLLSKLGRETPYPITKPDATKLLRGTEDALKGICWVDDAQVVKPCPEKLWGSPSRVEIIVEEILVEDPDVQPALFVEEAKAPWE
jgi:Holliday junction resolvase RusA-like endonuclease